MWTYKGWQHPSLLADVIACAVYCVMSLFGGWKVPTAAGMLALVAHSAIRIVP